MRLLVEHAVAFSKRVHPSESLLLPCKPLAAYLLRRLYYSTDCLHLQALNNSHDYKISAINLVSRRLIRLY